MKKDKFKAVVATFVAASLLLLLSRQSYYVAAQKITYTGMETSFAELNSEAALSSRQKRKLTGQECEGGLFPKLLKSIDDGADPTYLRAITSSETMTSIFVGGSTSDQLLTTFGAAEWPVVMRIDQTTQLYIWEKVYRIVADSEVNVLVLSPDET